MTTQTNPKLTKRQKEELEVLQRAREEEEDYAEGWVYVGYSSRDIMKIYNKLVEKGYAKVIWSSGRGQKYIATATS